MSKQTDQVIKKNEFKQWIRNPTIATEMKKIVYYYDPFDQRRILGINDNKGRNFWTKK